MRFDTQTTTSVKCDGPDCKVTDRQHTAQPSVPLGWYVVQQDGSRVFHNLSCLREWLGHWTVYRGGDVNPNATATELREFWQSLRFDKGSGPCRVHGRGCEYNHGV